MTVSNICPISGYKMKPIFSEVVLGKYDVMYSYCEASGIIQTEKPYWLDEAYQDAIAGTDIGLVSRNILNSRRLEPILQIIFSGKGKFLDVGGGYGILARLMRDRGFDCYTFDKYCKNLFARGFEPNAGFKAEALFAFEVFEHIHNPIEFLTGVFDKYDCKTIIFSTLTYSNNIPTKDWWYYSFEAGQHITFYQPRTLAMLAKKLGCRYYLLKQDLHIITDININRLDLILLTNKYLFLIFSLYTRYKRRKLSKQLEDHLLMQKQLSL